LLNWHRLFGIALIDLFTDSGYEVELEKELSIKQQFLDVVVVRRRDEPGDIALPDGLEDLTTHNLITYKSLHESLNRWALDELVSHFVNYRKLIAEDRMLPYEQFALYALTTRFPRDLAAKVDLHERLPGVLEVQWGAGTIRIIVLKNIRKIPRNAYWLLFSAQAESFRYARETIDLHDDGKIDLIVSLERHYHQEGLEMPYTVQDYNRDVVKEIMHTLDPKDRLAGLEPNQVFDVFSTNQILSGLSPEKLEQLRQALREHKTEP